MLKLLIELVGVASIVAGCALVSIPVALVVAGLAVVVAVEIR